MTQGQQAQPVGVVVLGGINMDLVTMSSRFPLPGETVVGDRFLTYPGGKGANQAVAAARMGARVAMVGRVGDDVFGPQLKESLAADGIDVSGVAVEEGSSSGIAVVSIDASGQNQIIQILGANTTCGQGEAEQVRRALGPASVILLQLEVSIDLSLQVARDAFALGKTVILDPGPARPLPAEFYSYCSVITPNETEAQALVGFPVTDQASAARAAEELLGRGVGAAVIKLGAQGAFYATREDSEFVLPFPVRAVDSVAAGDAFNGALAVSLAEGMTLAQSLRVASAAGALAVTVSGAQDSMPSRADVETLIRSNPA
ncbi:MAG: ribokinase [Chloroflexi bacterium]|nr:ribokinase [Chloroflexota bacterium]MCI0867973.1 ribokinase [Chloroflexota bacterium]MCI0878962.1 ribokinase [Chloroflexota bacterium]